MIHKPSIDVLSRKTVPVVAILLVASLSCQAWLWSMAPVGAGVGTGLLLAGIGASNLLLGYLVARSRFAGRPMRARVTRGGTGPESAPGSNRRMEAAGRLAVGVAHDLNNYLSVILGSTEALAESPSASSDPENLRRLERIDDAATRATRLTRRLLNAGRQGASPSELVNVTRLSEELMRAVDILIGEQIELETKLEQRIHLVRADPVQIEQLLMNLAMNARDAMPHGGKLTIEITSETRELQRREDAEHHVILAVEDTGTGIGPDTRERMFQPYFTTKGDSGGSGLGLVTVREIVDTLGGQISLDSRQGRGTRFTIRIPSEPTRAGDPPPSDDP